MNAVVSNTLKCLATSAVAVSMMAGTGPASAKDLVFLAEDIPAGLDYNGPSATVFTSQTGVVNLLEPLLDYSNGKANDEGVMMPDFAKYEGHLVESWSYDAPSLTWTFKLKRGLKSCAGNELTADDIIYTFARAKSVSGAAPIGWFLASVASVKGFTPDVFKNEGARKLGNEVRKVDDYAFTITQSMPNKLFLPVLSIFALDIVDKKEMDKHATDKDPWAHDYMNNVNAPGWGAYCLDKWVKGDEIVFKANENYWRGKPDIDHVIMKRVPQSGNRLMVLRTDQAQLVQGLTPREFDTLRSVPSVKVEGVLGNQFLFAGMNFKSPPFDNVKFRQAVAYALNYDQVTKTGYYGQAKKWDGVIPTSYPGFEKAPDTYNYNLRKAKQLLAEAGYPDGKGLEKYTDSLKLSYVAERESVLGPVATVIQNSLRQIGLPIQLDPIPQTQFGERQTVKKDLPFSLISHETPFAVDAGFALQLYFVSPEQGGFNNLVNYRDPKLDALWDKARVEPDTTIRTGELNEAQDILMKSVVWLPIVEYKTQWAMSKTLSGMTWYTDNSIRFSDLKLGQ